jgi:hypothetical protein
MMQDIKNKAIEIIEKYEDKLTAKGIKITVSKKYFESAVLERHNSYGGVVGAYFSYLDRARDRRDEIKNGYNFEKNKYHCLVLTLSPLDKTKLTHKDCREYAFLLKKAERAHIGIEPQRKSYEEAKVLAKIEKRIVKILKKAETQTVQQIYKNTIFDALRYVSSSKYEYKEKFCGKDRHTWDTIHMILCAAGTLLFLIIAYGIIELIRM